MENTTNKTSRKYIVIKPSTHKLLLQCKLDLEMPSLSKTIRYLISEHNKTKQIQEKRGDGRL